MSISDKIIKANEIFGLFSENDEITVALSGGADSVCLLHALNGLKSEFKFSLKAAHFNHGIRGKEADDDEEFARNLCKMLDIPFVSEKGDVPKFAKEKSLSLETAARELRYDFLNRVSNGKTATAHTASDNLETMIFNLSRGASLEGIKGIPPKRDNIIRPIILCERQEIEDYCKENGLKFVTDSTNLLCDCSRNLIRQKIIPVLKEINESCTLNASKLSLLLNEDSNYLNAVAKEKFSKIFDGERLNLKDFSKIDKAVANRIIVMFYKEYLGALPDNYHIEELYSVCIGKQKRTSLFDDICGENEGGYLKFLHIKESDAEFKTEILKISAEEFSKRKKIHELFLNNAIDYDKIAGELRKVGKNSSDLIKLANSNSTKTVKKLLTEKKVPLKERKNLPVFADDEGIVWCFKVGTADRVKVDGKTKTVLYFKTDKLGENNTYDTK